MKPIFIPSKNRPDSKLFQMLKDEGLDFTIFIEPQDSDKYKKYNTITLKENNKGIVYVRQAILNHARTNNIDWYWMFDDDVANFFKLKDRTNISSTIIEALTVAESKINDSIGQIGFEYQQYSWSASKPIIYNSYCDVVVCINSKVFANYRDLSIDGFMKEDRDFTLQILSSGLNTIRICVYSFSCPQNGSNIGGLSHLYKKEGHEEACSKAMEKAWPGICKFNKKANNRPDVKINWGHFKRKI